jgi:preprotein translocase subunit SecY
MRSPLFRVALTIFLPLMVVIAGDHVLLPGMEEMLGALAPNVSIFALGIMPALTAYGIVELAAFLVPRWSALRHGNPEGRAKLARAARAVAIALAVFQAWGMATAIAGLDKVSSPFSGPPDLPSSPVIVATLVGGVCVQIVVAEVITRQGIANGYVLLTVVESIAALRGGFGTRLQKALFLGQLEPKHVVLIVLVIALPVVATWLALRGADGDRVQDATTREAGGAGPYRAARALTVSPWVPVPSCSVTPYAIAVSLITLPSTVLFFLGSREASNAWLDALASPVAYTIAMAVTTGLVGAAFARLLHRPREMADVASRLGFSGGEEVAHEARAALRATLVPTVLFFATLALAANAANALPAVPSVAFVPLLVALVMDVARSARALGRVAVWQERRASVVPVVRAVLESEGIDVVVRGMSTLSLLQAFAPYAPAEILVTEADAARATAILRHVFLGEPRPEAEPPRETPRDRKRAAPFPPSRRNFGLAIVAAASLVALVLANLHDRPHEAAKGPRRRLEIVRVDDRMDVFGDYPDSLVPKGVEIRWEVAPIGPGRTQRVHFARAGLLDGESYEDAFRRMRTWCDRAALPPGTRLGLEAVEEYDEDTNKLRRVGVRTFLLTEAPIITTDDVVDAAASVSEGSGLPEVYVAVTLSPDAAERFRIATREYIQRRIAIIVDGEINSAPVVKSEIGGGRLSITMGAGDPERQLAQAKALANNLRAH